MACDRVSFRGGSLHSRFVEDFLVLLTRAYLHLSKLDNWLEVGPTALVLQMIGVSL